MSVRERSIPRVEMHSDASDDRLAALAESGDAWGLAAAALGRVERDESDGTARVYLGVGACLIGCPELALWSVGGLGGEDAGAVRESAAGLGASALDAGEAARVCRGNLDAMPEDARASLEDEFAEWERSGRTGERALHRAAGRNVIVRAGDRWRLVADERTAALGAELGFAPATGASTANDLPGMVAVGWFKSPWLLARVIESLRGGAQGYTPRVCVVETAPAARALDALATRDLRALLGRSSVRWFLGEGAAARFGEDLEGAWRWALPERVIVPAGRGVDVAVASALERARGAQAARLEADTSRVAIARAGMTAGRWAKRYAEALEGGGPPLRVLIPATRYTTYVRHAARALAGAVERAGHTALYLEEETGDVRPAATLEASAHAAFDPDLTVVINWPRALRGNAWPGGAPAACWVQDMLGHLFDPAVGAAQGELDFTAGVVHGALVRDFGYPLGRTVFHTTPACPATFHDGPVDAERAARFACDVAYVSHQSEPARVLLERLLALAGSAEEADVVRAIDAAVRDALERGEAPGVWEFSHQALHELTRACVEERAGAAREAMVSRVAQMATLPLAERRWRHQMIGWAGRVCARRGLTLGLYGRGWEKTEFAAHARGEVGHHEDLRACYAVAGCHLHASLGTNAHQRVFECALSGGLMLRRGPSPDAPAIWQGSRQRLLAGEPDFERNGRSVFLVPEPIERLAPDARSPDIVRLNAAIDRPMPPAIERGGRERRAETAAVESEREAIRWLPRMPLEQFPDWSCDDAAAARFRTEEELEEAIDRMALDRARRAAAAAHHRERALAFNTTDEFWRALVRGVRSGLERA